LVSYSLQKKFYENETIQPLRAFITTRIYHYVRILKENVCLICLTLFLFLPFLSIGQNLFEPILTSELTEKQKATLDNQLKLNSNDIPDGMYFLKLFIGQKTLSQKVILKQP
jgi:hypothetical protein